MKRSLYRISMFAAVLAMALGCSKENSEPQPEVFERTVKVSFTKGVDTKTALVEGEDKASYVWTEGDEEYFRIYENDKLGNITETSYSSDMKRITLTVSFATVLADQYVYRATFAEEFSNAGNMRIQADQSPGEDTYDPDAEVMYTDEVTSESALTTLHFMMHRPITVNKMTLKGLVPGEKIKTVEMTFDKNVTGYYVVTGNAAGTYSNGAKKLTLTYDDVTVPSNGEFPVYFIAMPVENAGFESVVVSTDQYTYTKPTSAFSKKISFTIGKMTRFGMNMSGYATPVSTTTTYTLVENETGLTDGTYIIVASGFNYAMGGLSGDIHTSESVVIKTDNTIVLDNNSPVLPVKLTKNGSNWTIQNDKITDSKYGYYLAWTSGNTSTEQSSVYKWNISVSNGVATITSVNTSERSLQYNEQSPRFCCYKSTQTPVALYKSSGTAPTSAIVVTSNPLAVGKAGGSQTVSYTITNPVSGQTLTAVSNNSWITNVVVNGYNITFDVAAQANGASSRTGTITLSYEGASSVNLIIDQEPGEGGGQAVTGWLELPAVTTGSNIFNGVFYDSDGTTRNYSYHYDKSKYTALWSAYPLTYRHTTGSASSNWAYNTQFDKIYQINVVSNSYPTNYGNSTYSRGHQVPNADRKCSSQMNKATYLMTNQTPQNQNGFNGTIWQNLETAIRALVPSSSTDTVYVVTGATFQTVGGSETINYLNAANSSITPSKVPIPNYYWKVLLKVKWDSSRTTVTSALAIGFWYEHKSYASGESYSKAQYVKSVNQIEELTGFNFFVNLPSNLEETAEANTSWSQFQNF